MAKELGKITTSDGKPPRYTKVVVRDEEGKIINYVPGKVINQKGAFGR